LVQGGAIVALPDLARGNGSGDGNGDAKGKSEADGNDKGNIDGEGNGDGEGTIEGEGKGDGNGSPTCRTVRGASGLRRERMVEGTLGGAAGCGS
jgi:hypothetical protein